MEAWLRSPPGAKPSTLPGSGCGKSRGDDSPGTTAAAGGHADPAQGRRGCGAVTSSAPGRAGGPDVVYSLFAYPLMDNYAGE